MSDTSAVKVFECDKCEYVSKRHFDLLRHQKRHTKVKITNGIGYKCCECSFVSKWKFNMRRHMERHKGKITSQPEIIPFSSQDEKLADDELNYELDVDEDDNIVETTITEVLPCPELLKEQRGEEENFGDSSGSDIVVVEKAPEDHVKRYICNRCKYTTNRLYDLRRHAEIHDKVKVIDGISYKCSECPFATEYKRNMNRHVQLKHPKPYEDVEYLEDESNDDDFEYLSVSSEEAPKHAKKVPIFRCDQCSYASKRAFDLKRHEQRHLKQKVYKGIVYQCRNCSFITKWKRNMKRHVQRHQELLANQPKSVSDAVDDLPFEKYIMYRKPFKEFNKEEEEDEDTPAIHKLEIEVVESDEVQSSYWVVIPHSKKRNSIVKLP